MTVDEAIAQVLKYHGCGHPVMKAAGVLRLEVERLRKSDAFHAERLAAGQERCEECGKWFDLEQMVLTADGCYLCYACADSLREDEAAVGLPHSTSSQCHDDLLAALQSLLDGPADAPVSLEEAYPTMNAAEKALIDQARAAIAKATQ